MKKFRAKEEQEMRASESYPKQKVPRQKEGEKICTNPMNTSNNPIRK